MNHSSTPATVTPGFTPPSSAWSKPRAIHFWQEAGTTNQNKSNPTDANLLKPPPHRPPRRPPPRGPQAFLPHCPGRRISGYRAVARRHGPPAAVRPLLRAGQRRVPAGGSAGGRAVKGIVPGVRGHAVELAPVG